MKTPSFASVPLVLIVVTLVLSACGFAAPEPTATPVPPTDTPEPTATITLTPTNTPRPSPTPRPTRTPNLAATQRTEELHAKAQAYFDLGYLKSADGSFEEYDDFEVEWAQLNWFRYWPLGQTASDFYMSAHFNWSSAFQNADISGCGFVFALTPDDLYYAVFLDRTQVLFLTKNADGRIREIGRTRGGGVIRFDNPAEADFTLIVKSAYAYVLVNDEVVGEYTLSQSKPLRGDLGLTVLSGTNKDYGTRCEMTDLHVWTPDN